MTTYGLTARKKLDVTKGYIIVAMNNAVTEDLACLFNLLEDMDALLELRKDLVRVLSEQYGTYAGRARARMVAEKIAEGTF